jgi:cysteine desulfurase/selenocysteine lyase
MTNTVLSNGCLSGVREQFPIFTADLDAPLVYLDTAASSQTPQCVIDAMTHFYCSGYSNIHRGVHRLSAQATLDYEAVRDSVQHFINAEHREEIVFTSGTTAAINLVAECFSASHMQPGDEIIISAMEHHANIVPWQMLRDRMGVVLKVLPMDDNGECCLQQLSELISDKTKLLTM